MFSLFWNSVITFGPVPLWSCHSWSRVQYSARYRFQIIPCTHRTPYLNKFGILKMEARQKLYFVCLMFDVIKTRKLDYYKIKWSRSARENTATFVSKILLTSQETRLLFAAVLGFVPVSAGMIFLLHYATQNIKNL